MFVEIQIVVNDQMIFINALYPDFFYEKRKYKSSIKACLAGMQVCLLYLQSLQKKLIQIIRRNDAHHLIGFNPALF